MAQSRYKQDMPPPGGFGKINIDRIHPRIFMKTPVLFAGAFIITGYFMGKHKERRTDMSLEKLEDNDTNLALQPFILAERDRMYLKHLRRIRDEEAEIMKDVPGWEVGTLFGERIYKTAPPDYHMDPTVNEVYAHNSLFDTLYQWSYSKMLYNLFLDYRYYPKEEKEEEEKKKDNKK